MKTFVLGYQSVLTLPPEKLQNDSLNVLRLIGENISLCGMKIVVGTHTYSTDAHFVSFPPMWCE